MSILMEKKYLLDAVLQLKQYKNILDHVEGGSNPLCITGPSESQKVHITGAICHHLGKKALFVAYNEAQARKIFEDATFLYGNGALFYGTKEIMLHDVEAKSNDSIYDRVRSLYRITQGDYEIIVTSTEAISHKLVSKDLFTKGIIRISYDDTIDLQSMIEKLVFVGYERVSTVEGRGQFAIRGGILDIFPVNSENGIRVELFDDVVDSIRIFDVMTQRSLENMKEFVVLPAREVIYAKESKDSIVENILRELEGHLKNIKNNKEYVKKLESKIRGDIDKFHQENYFPGMDRYIPYIISEPHVMTQYIEEDILIFVDEPQRFEQRAENIILESSEMNKGLLEKGYILPGGFDLYFEYQYLWNTINQKKCIYLNTILSSKEYNNCFNVSIVSKLLNSYQGNMELLLDDIEFWKKKNNKVLILAGTKSRGEMLVQTLINKDIEASYVHDFNGEILNGQIVITHGSMNKGFEYPDIGFVVICEKALFGQDRKTKRTPKAKGKKINVFTDLKVGDYVVHQSHGIGKYVSIEQLVVENIKKDYLKIQYHDGDYLYVPTNQMDIIQKYIGSEGKTPKLSRLGGSDWLKTKAKAKESLMELAGELIKIYAMREAQKGHSFSKDTVWQKQFEEIFPYQETDDQLKCIEDIKRDMEGERPMDRLLCGDVGYGKTEVALRAIFKAVTDGKQVAYLVPTTVLAQQQYSNFKERMKDFPVTVEVISRFRTQSEQKKILKDVKSGVVDVLVGTHRLLQKDIAFKDLGLLVVDEEQRFGVMHKEKLKNLKVNVDTLTLTATPIPRTLHMSLVGIRDISTIEEPPEERYPVQTYVMEHNKDVISDAINREISRNGQVFYLYNRVRSINIKAAEIKEMVPDVNVATAHGQMSESELEDIMYRFVNGEIDVLVCTTIIESGLDMPNVNTIIVEDADRMGLAQLYQLRGRVGRSNRLAYAYITYKKDKVLSEIAEKRLQAIKEFTEFGSGFKIAMRDLQIRGAGNLLGAQQHGHIDLVGYDMYCKLLSDAVEELRGNSTNKEDVEITIDLNVSAYIDKDYIENETDKIEMYKKIASISSEQDFYDVEEELMDRYGEIPKSVKNLTEIAYIKYLSGKCEFSSLQEKNGSLIFQYKDNANVSIEVIGKLMEKYKRKILFNAGSKPYLTYRLDGIKRDDLLENIKILLHDINKLK